MRRMPGRSTLAVALAALLPFQVLVARASEPVATVRVAFDRDGITATEVHGLADKATSREVSAGDPVRIASISKLVTAIGVMRLVPAGQLDPDAHVCPPLAWPRSHRP